jgi:hypothetical protein
MNSKEQKSKEDFIDSPSGGRNRGTAGHTPPA